MLYNAAREKLVINLYNQGKTIREIAKEARMSFRDIGSILKNEIVKNENINNQQQQNSNYLTPLSSNTNKISGKYTEAYKLFYKGKKPLEVAIKLNLGAEEVGKLYREHWNLKGLYKLTSVYEEIKDHIPSFLKLFKIIKQNGMGKNEVLNALKYADNLPDLEEHFQYLNADINMLESQRSNLKGEVHSLQKQIHELKKCIGFYQEDMVSKAEMCETIINDSVELEKYIGQIKNNRDYREVEKVAEEKSKSILTEKKELLIAAIISSLRAIVNDPNKQDLLDYVEYCSSSSYNSNNTSLMQREQKYLHAFHKQLLQIAEQFYDEMLNVSVKNSMHLIIHNSDKR